MSNQNVVTPEMFLGLKEVIGTEITMNGSRPKFKIHRPPLGALGKCLVMDIGRRIYGNQVETIDTTLKRTGRTLEQHKAHNEELIRQARIKYAGEKNIWGLTITKPFGQQ